VLAWAAPKFSDEHSHGPPPVPNLPWSPVGILTSLACAATCGPRPPAGHFAPARTTGPPGAAGPAG